MKKDKNDEIEGKTQTKGGVKSTPNKLRVFEMFAGYGGASFGLKKAGIPFECVGTSEINKYAMKVFTQNHKGFHYGDATKIEAAKLPDFDLLTGGFPCQAFSVAGKREGFEDTRGTLIYDILRIAMIKKPKYMLLENVKGLLNHDNGKTFSIIINAIKNIGYDVRYKVLNSCDYGTPQNRERIFILCDRDGFEPFKELFPREEKLKLTLKDLLEDKVDKKYYLSKKKFLTAKAYLKKRNGNNIKNNIDREIGMCLTARSQTRSLHDVNLVIHSKQPRTNTSGAGGSGHLMKFGDTSYCVDTGNSQYIEYNNKLRVLTPTECFRLMGFFNDEIDFSGVSDSKAWEMAGNGWDINLVSKIFKKWLYGQLSDNCQEMGE